jgi:integrase
MANTTTNLTDTQLKRAKPRDKEYNLSDPGGLQLRIKPTGTKAWLINYRRPFTGKRTNMKIGVYPDLPLVNARKIRDEYRELLAKNIDPQEYKQEQSKKNSEAYSNTLKHVADKWFSVKSSEITKDYADDLYNSLDNHIFPKLGNKPIHKINAPETIDVLEPLAVKGKLELVKRICQRLNMIMNYAVRTGIVAANPLFGIGEAFKAPQKKHLPTIRPEELPKLMKAIENANIKLVTRCLMEWQLHTMVRPSEAAGAMWEEIDIENRLWNIPAKRMKKRKAHSVPLSEQTVSILELLRPISGHRAYLFPSDIDPKKHANSATVNMALKRMGFNGTLVSHSFRSLASTTLNERAFDADVIEAALAHQDKNSVRSAYNRAEYLERRRVLMLWWSKHIEEAAIGKKPSYSKEHLKVV